MNNKIIVALCAMFCVLPMYGQKFPGAKDVVAKMQEALKKAEAMEFQFTFRAEEAEGDLLALLDGIFVAQGESFRMETEPVEMYCDGTTKWLYDKSNAEITIYPHDPNTVEIAENPFSVLGKITPEDFVFRTGVKEVDRDGKALAQVTLVPKDKEVSYTEVVLELDPATWMPVNVEYASVGGQKYYLHIKEAIGVSKKDARYFTPSAELLDDPEIYVTDMR